MATRPERRRQGADRAVRQGLSTWAAARGATRVYLQVEEGNAGARALYAAAGFGPGHSYWYRTRPDAT
jgi:N-acetylglutamate synthase